MSWRERYRGARVLVTGDTGFKGAWLSCWLDRLGADVHGIGLPPGPAPNLFDVLQAERWVAHVDLDIRDRQATADHVRSLRPDIVFHLAAQPLVRRSFLEPLATLDTNVGGTTNVLAAIEAAGYSTGTPGAVVIVSSDKCYENPGASTGLAETAPMGGHDLYSASKGMVELLVAAWRQSFGSAAIRRATARAGNVIGGGDWAEDRIVPDCVRALASRSVVAVRNPGAQRPWQHVLEALSGYLQLGARLLQTEVDDGCCAGFNFGPRPGTDRTVGALCDAIVERWGEGSWRAVAGASEVREAHSLRLAIDKADDRLGWRPVWSFDETVAHTVDWYRAGVDCDHDRDAMSALTRDQIDAYSAPVGVA